MELIGFIIRRYMIDNYEKDEYGIIHQIDVQPFYKDYGKERNDYGPKSMYLSYLRLGFIITSTRLETTKSILDIGFGNGDFLRACDNYSTSKYGFDLDYKYLPDNSMKGNLTDYYEVITMFDSLEHFNDLSIIFKLKCKYLILSVPNCKKPNDDEWLSNWKHLRPNEHLHHMNLSSILAFTNRGYSMVAHSYLEDQIRLDPKETENILTVCLKKH